MSTSRFQSGAAWGLPVMKFTLTFDGELPASTNGSRKLAEKWAIRKHFDPQLRELWEVHPALRELKRRGPIPKDGYWWIEGHHSRDERSDRSAPRIPQDGDIDLMSLTEKGGYKFFPLVRESLALVCGLKVLFLRKETPGKVYQGGDLDNRIKTLLDALCMPQHLEQVVDGDKDAPDPIFCLLEDDSLIAGLNVESERLLTAPNATANTVRLVIEVDVRVTQARLYNSLLLAD